VLIGLEVRVEHLPYQLALEKGENSEKYTYC